MGKNNTIDEDEKALLDFLTDIKCLEPIEDRAEKFNIFDVFGFAKNEIRHSYFLKWLLDPNGNHCLNDRFIKALITCLVSAEPDRYGVLSFSLLMMDCSDFIVKRETNDIDLFLYSELNSVVIVIENKIGSHEHSSNGFDSQLDKYRTYIEKAYPNTKTKMYVYLSPTGESPRDTTNWQALSYLSIAEIIEELLNDYKDRLPTDIKALIQNYIDVLRRDIVDDYELDQRCNEIYKKHRKALDLIYTHSDLGENPAKIAIKEALSELYSEGFIEYNSKAHDIFYTHRMTEYLPNFSKPESAWGNHHSYRYWIERNGEKIKLIFDISFKGADEAIKPKLERLFSTRSSQSKKKNTYNRIHTLGETDLSDLEDEDKKNKIKKLVLELINKEEASWIKLCEDPMVKKE